MPAVRIRKPFAASFAALLLLSAYLGLSTQKIPQYGQSDKGLHFIAFFLLTVTFYWILETSRRRCIHITLVVCTAGLGIGSEVVQALIPNNGREFDPFDILANVVGSTLGLLLCSWYHRRMLERKRKNKHYDIVPGEEPVDDEERDVELGTIRDQEEGVIPVDANGSTGQQTEAGAKKTDVTEELDNWDENAEDWDDEPDATVDGKAGEEGGDSKKRVD